MKKSKPEMFTYFSPEIESFMRRMQGGDPRAQNDLIQFMRDRGVVSYSWGEAHDDCPLCQLDAAAQKQDVAARGEAVH